MPYGYDSYQPRKVPSYGPRDPEHETYRKLFIGGLSYETTDDSLKKHFEQWGEVVDCIIMKDPNTKRSRGFGFITYKDSAMVDEAQSHRPHKIDGREVESKRAMPREESGNPETQISVNKMFIGGLKDDTTEDQVREVFKEFGKIESVNLIADKQTGKLKGFGFVEFDDYDCVDKAVLRKRHPLNGKDVEVKKAQNKDQQMGWGMRGGRGGRGGGGGGRGGGTADTVAVDTVMDTMTDMVQEDTVDTIRDMLVATGVTGADMMDTDTGTRGAGAVAAVTVLDMAIAMQEDLSRVEATTAAAVTDGAVMGVTNIKRRTGCPSSDGFNKKAGKRANTSINETGTKQQALPQARPSSW